MTSKLAEWIIDGSCPLALLIHSADPQSLPVGIIVFAHVVRTNKTKRKQCSLLARLWIWPSGSLMTPVLYSIFLMNYE